MQNKSLTSLATAFATRLSEVGETEGGAAVLAAWSAAKGRAVRVNGPAAMTFGQSVACMALQLGWRVLVQAGAAEQLAQWETHLRLRQPLPAPLVPSLAPSLVPSLAAALADWSDWRKHCLERPFGEHTAADLLGLGWDALQEPGNDLLSPYLSTHDFNFEAQEWLACREQISSTQRLLAKTGPLPAVIQELHTGIFKYQDLADSEQFIREKVGQYSADAQQLLRAYLSQTTAFYQDRAAFFRSIGQSLAEALRRCQLQQDKLTADFPAADLATAPSRLGIGKKQKLLKTATQALHEQLRALYTLHQQQRPFLLEWPEKLEGLAPNDCFVLLKNYQAQLAIWLEEIPNQLREESLGLSSKSIPPTQRGVVTSESLADLEQALNELVERIHDGGLFQRPFTTQANTSARQQKLLEQLVEKFQQLAALLPNFSLFYRWQYHWFSLAAKVRRVLAPLLLLPEDQWLEAFDRWYLYHALQKTPLPKLSMPQQANLPTLFTEIATAKAKLARQTEAPTLVPPQLPQPPQLPALPQLQCLSSLPDSVADIDLLICLEPSAEVEAQLAAKETQRTGYLLRIAPLLSAATASIVDTTVVDSSHAIQQPNFYLSQQADYLPSMAFFRSWTSSRLPEWQALLLPPDFHQLTLALQASLSKDAARPVSLEAVQRLSADFPQPQPIIFYCLSDGTLARQPLWAPLADGMVAACLLLPAHFQLAALLALPLPRLAELLYRVPSIHLLHRLPTDVVNQALLTDGLNPAFLVAAFLRASEAIAEGDLAAFQAIAAEQRHRIGYPRPKACRLATVVAPLLQTALPNYRLRLHQAWRDTFLPLLLKSPQGKQHLVLIDGLLPTSEGLFTDLQRQEMLLAAGFQLHYLATNELLKNKEAALAELVQRILA